MMNGPEQQHPQIDSLELAAERFRGKLDIADVYAHDDPRYDLYVPESDGDVDVRTAVVRLWDPSLSKLRERDFFVLRETAVYSPEEYGGDAARIQHRAYTLTPLSARSYNDKHYVNHFPVVRLTKDVDSTGEEHTSFYAAEVSVSTDGTMVQEVKAHDADELAKIASSLHPVRPDELKQRAVKKIPRQALRAKQRLAEDVDVMALLEQQVSSPDAAVIAHLGASAVQGK